MKLLKTTFIFFTFTLVNLTAYSQLTPQQAVLQMQKAINLGNTFEPPTEAGWNNPKAQEYYFDLYKDAGFDCVRVPVRWDNYTGKTPPYAISAAWLDRIEQVVDWGLSRDLFIVMNAHHDNWIKENYSTENKARFDSIWTQIAARFKNKSEKLIFEVLNEPHGLTKANNDDMHARIISIIRKTNPTRLIIFQGHNWGGSEELITAAIPDDKYLIGSFHSYDPYLFGLEGQGTWGTASDYNSLDQKFKKVYDWSVKNNIPVFLGEFGSLKKCEYNSRMRHYRAYMELSQKYGFVPVAWDDGGDFRIMERQQKTWHEVKDILIHTTAYSPKPVAEVYQDSIVRVRWTNLVTNHDSIIVQRKAGTEASFQNIAVLKPDTSSFFDVKPPVDRNYYYRILAHYSDTSDLYSQPVTVFFPKWAKRVQSPFKATPFLIPGVIEAEDFDLGGEDLAYHDADDSNIAGDYRPNEAVDIYDRLGNGYHVGNTVAGEWLEYTVDIKTEGWYNVSAHISTYTGGGSFQISIDSLKSDTIQVKSTYSAINTKPFPTKMYLEKGVKTMRFSIISGPQFNIDYFSFELNTGISESAKTDLPPFTAWQNGSGDLSIRLTHNAEVKLINIYNVSGVLIQRFNNPETFSIVPKFLIPGGVYIVQGISGNNRFQQKIAIR